ncbi:hypothetical protein C8J57DRAFT_1246895 [Mycena rebaudengoi]|nr:hypothetical protein C8J57DRAFT_1246895 [Mycena rebaudengoi]
MPTGREFITFVGYLKGTDIILFWLAIILAKVLQALVKPLSALVNNSSAVADHQISAGFPEFCDGPAHQQHPPTSRPHRGQRCCAPSATVQSSLTRALHLPSGQQQGQAAGGHRRESPGRLLARAQKGGHAWKGGTRPVTGGRLLARMHPLAGPPLIPPSADFAASNTYIE